MDYNEKLYEWYDERDRNVAKKNLAILIESNGY